MAQTRTITRGKLAAISVIDSILRPAAAAHRRLMRRPSGQQDGVSKILVIELWGIGDVVLATPALAALRAGFPNAHLSLLAKPYAEELLRESGLVDEVIAFDFPWTGAAGRYSPARYEVPAILALLRRLRDASYDVTIDARRDVRSNLVAYATGAPRRIGFDFGGGSYLLTDAMPSGDQSGHKVADWLELLAPLGINTTGDERPILRVAQEENRWAEAEFAARGITRDKPVLAVHSGASRTVRRWPASRYAAALEHVRDIAGAQVVILSDATGCGDELAALTGAATFNVSLREMMALISRCDAMLCADSGPMHIATALGTPVIALFGPQRREWYGPRGTEHAVVQVDEMPCRPCFDACRFAEPFCMTRLSEQSVADAVIQILKGSRGRNIGAVEPLETVQ